jgi:hypothetical protein
MREKQNDKAFANTFSALINVLRMQGVCTWGWVESEAFAPVSWLNQAKTLMHHIDQSSSHLCQQRYESIAKIFKEILKLVYFFTTYFLYPIDVPFTFSTKKCYAVLN